MQPNKNTSIKKTNKKNNKQNRQSSNKQAKPTIIKQTSNETNRGRETSKAVQNKTNNNQDKTLQDADLPKEDQKRRQALAPGKHWNSSCFFT